MKRGFFILTGLAAAVSCGLTEVGVGDSTVDEGIWIRPDTGSSAAERAPACLMTAFDYPDGYDWRSADAESARCNLVLLEGGSPLMRIPVGSGYEVSHDADRHRIIDGHLYTDYTSGDEIVVRKDGALLFRYKADERIVGMTVENGNVYTLGIPASGTGFAYRRNGVIQLAKHSGYAFERLVKDVDDICFAYCSQIVTESETRDEYYMVRDGVERLISMPEGCDRVWDIAPHEGSTCVLASSVLKRTSYLITGDAVRRIDMPSSSEMLSCRFLTGGKSICMEGLYGTLDGRQVSALWMDADEYRRFDDGLSISAARADETGIDCVLNPTSEAGGGMIFRSGKAYAMPSGYSCMGVNPMAVLDGALHVGLSSLKGGRPLVWKDGALDTLDINGYICTAAVSIPENL